MLWLDVLIIIYHSSSLLTLIFVIFESFVFIFHAENSIYATLCWKGKAHVHLPDENRSVTCNRLASTFPMTRIKPEFIIEYSITSRESVRVAVECGATMALRNYGQVNGVWIVIVYIVSRRVKAMEKL